jgi:OPA family glycerol-3-phosphate transporter-like MFS transporter
MLSGTATMDFGGRKAAGTAVGLIDGLVYLGTGVQSLALGYITTWNWHFWPIFLIPFSLIGIALTRRIWHAIPKGRSSAH